MRRGIFHLYSEDGQNGIRQGRSKRRGEAYVVLYVEPLSDARTQLGAIFTILPTDVPPPTPLPPVYVHASRSV
jgi:hypothetical protein